MGLKACLGGKAKQRTVLVLGLANSGKTTLLQNMKNEPEQDISPTLGFQIQRARLPRGLKLLLVDLSGHPRYRHLWDCFYSDAGGLVYVVDAAAPPSTFRESTSELRRLLSHPSLHHLPLLLLANKMDCLGERRMEEVVERLKVEVVKEGGVISSWRVATCSAKTGEGVEEMLTWLKLRIR